MINKKIEFIGTEDQVNNLMELLKYGDNDLPKIVSISTEESSEENIFTDLSWKVKSKCGKGLYKDWTRVSSFLAAGLQGVDVIKVR